MFSENLQTDGGDVWVWGSNQKGQLGSMGRGIFTSPEGMGLVNRAKAVACGNINTMILDGSLSIVLTEIARDGGRSLGGGWSLQGISGRFYDRGDLNTLEAPRPVVFIASGESHRAAVDGNAPLASF